MLEKYPSLRSPAVINSASYLVVQLKDFAEQVCRFFLGASLNFLAGNYDSFWEFYLFCFFQDEITDEKEFHDALDSLALTFSNRVSEYLTGDIDPKASGRH